MSHVNFLGRYGKVFRAGIYLKKVNLVLGSRLWQQQIYLLPGQVQFRMLWWATANAVPVRFTTGSLLCKIAVSWDGSFYNARAVWRPPNLVRTPVSFVLSQPEAIDAFQLLLLPGRHTWWAVLWILAVLYCLLYCFGSWIRPWFCVGMLHPSLQYLSVGCLLRY